MQDAESLAFHTWRANIQRLYKKNCSIRLYPIYWKGFFGVRNVECKIRHIYIFILYSMRDLILKLEMNQSIANADFDVNILEDANTDPNITLTIPLPIDKDTYIDVKPNENVSNSFMLLGHFIEFISGVKFNEVYAKNEHRYSVNKLTKSFNDSSKEYMKRRLETTDERLDEIVYELVNSELRMNLIKAEDFPKRFKDVKEFMVLYCTAENKKNLPNFMSVTALRVCYVTVMKTLSKMFPQGVWVNNRQLSELFQEYLKNPMSIVLLPNHQSHLDYVIMHLIFMRFLFSIPVVIAGENLNVAVFGRILKGLGAIFIKRSFNNELYTERNLTNYVEYVFLNKVHFEVFIEGTRSRDGKLLLPKYGILKTLSSIYLNQRKKEGNKNFDLLLQPISITYERVYEAEGYLDELIGKDKKQESFMSILSNGVTNLIYGVDRDDKNLKRLEDGFITNYDRVLHGKIFVRLADRFTLSSFVEDEGNRVNCDEEGAISEEDINLKKLGFQILHAINGVSYLPQSAVVGVTIQTYYYLNGEREFPIVNLLPLMNFLIDLYLEENLNDSNMQILTRIKDLSDANKVDLIKDQVIRFFKYSRVNPDTNQLRIENSFELLYYKNLTIHLIIHKCLASFILLKTHNLNYINKLFYIFTGFLKNEFLFDYNYNLANNISNILKHYQDIGVINKDYKIIDQNYHKVLSTIIQPFIESFMVCLDNLNYTVGEFYEHSKNTITEQQLINDSLMLKDYPTTKSLLKIIQKDNVKNFHRECREYRVETYNKQYLLSFLFYLNNLRLIKIFKNKSKTKAYVIIVNSRDLKFSLRFIQNLILKNETDDTSINYMIDIVDKNPDRDITELKVRL